MSLEASLEELAGQGYTIVRGALTGPEVEATRQAVTELLDAEEEVARTTGTQTDNLRNATPSSASTPTSTSSTSTPR